MKFCKTLGFPNLAFIVLIFKNLIHDVTTKGISSAVTFEPLKAVFKWNSDQTPELLREIVLN